MEAASHPGFDHPMHINAVMAAGKGAHKGGGQAQPIQAAEPIMRGQTGAQHILGSEEPKSIIKTSTQPTAGGPAEGEAEPAKCSQARREAEAAAEKPSAMQTELHPVLGQQSNGASSVLLHAQQPQVLNVQQAAPTMQKVSLLLTSPCWWSFHTKW